jgi:hypothetical protein
VVPGFAGEGHTCTVQVPPGHSLFVRQNCAPVRPDGHDWVEQAVLAVLFKRSNEPQQCEPAAQSSALRQWMVAEPVEQVVLAPGTQRAAASL